MGRKKLQIKYEENDNKRQSLVSKRIPGVLKKLIELNQLTGTHIQLKMLDSNGKYWDLNTDEDDEERQEHFNIECEKAIQQNKFEKIDVIDTYNTLKGKTVLTKQDMCIRDDYKVIRPRIRSSTDPYPRRNHNDNPELDNRQVYKRRFTQLSQSKTLSFNHNATNNEITNVTFDQRQNIYNYEEDLAERMNGDIDTYFNQPYYDSSLPHSTDVNDSNNFICLPLPPPPPPLSPQNKLNDQQIMDPLDLFTDLSIDQQHQSSTSTSITIDYNAIFEVDGTNLEFGYISIEQHLIITRQIFHPVLFSKN